MVDIIIVGIIVIVVAFALRSSVKHFRGQGDCCGGGSVPKQKKVQR